ncbi:MAG: polysaccharide pyruvyl transferase [Bacteroidota bacterium]
MKLVEIKLRKNNFGDDLNEWLWPQIFANIDDNDNGYFLGIGTILLGGSPVLEKISRSKKIVFGSGVRPSELYVSYKPDSLTDIKFLRGPLSSQALDHKYEYITDAAYAVRQLDNFQQLQNTEKKYEISVMPYFHSVDYFDWKSICKKLGFHYISPLSENGVEFTLKEIAASRHLISEAMHGAIAADLLRVPWHRFVLTTPHTEGDMVSQFKWADWLQSIKIYNPQITFIPFYKKSRVHNWVKNISNNIIATEFLYKPYVKKRIVEKLALVKDFYLSDNILLSEIDMKILKKINQLKAEYNFQDNRTNA